MKIDTLEVEPTLDKVKKQVEEEKKPLAGATCIAGAVVDPGHVAVEPIGAQ